MSNLRLVPLAGIVLAMSACADPFAPAPGPALSADVVTATTTSTSTTTATLGDTASTCGSYVVAYGPVVVGSPAPAPSSGTCGGG